ncbi:MAG: hypothetical protein COA78_31390 [Blastopirellula sp.]|nr:MAG: hypothetical protein COA78_31390 [Blastopirellula sp.]
MTHDLSPQLPPLFNSVQGIWDVNSPIKFHYHNSMHSPIEVTAGIQAIMDNLAVIKLFAPRLNFEYQGLTSTAPALIPNGQFEIGFTREELFRSRWGLSWGYAYVWWASHIYDSMQSYRPAPFLNILETQGVSEANHAFRAINLHEWGHSLGVNHLNSGQHSIMANNPYNSWKFQGILRWTDMLQYWRTYGYSGEMKGYVLLDEDLTMYIPSMEWANAEYWIEMSYDGTVNGSHQFSVKDLGVIPEHYAVQITSCASIGPKSSRLVITEAFWKGSRYTLTLEAINTAATTWKVVNAELIP